MSTETALFSPWVIIPVYNHNNRLPGMLDGINNQGWPVVLIDDGSDEPIATHLDQLSSHPNITLLRNKTNQGKGNAVCRGLHYAARQGGTHALQIDADGQHSVDDIPGMLAASRNTPHAVISGERDYSAMTGARRHGRKITDFWVHVNTLSSAIHDSMCGFRVYPLAATTALLDHVRVGERMDFDTDILVRLYWRGVPVINIPITIVYEDAIDSHFRLVRDNLRITRMHTRLFLGMLIRLPALLLRRLRESI